MTSNSEDEKRENTRKRVLEEMYTSEVSYLQQLEKLLTYFIKPIQEANYFSHSDYYTIFGNIETIYNVNGELLKELKNDLNNVAFAFLKLAPFFKLYSFYAYDYKKGIRLLQNTQNTNESFKKFLEQQEFRDEVQMKLPALLITPIQRIPRYRLLLIQLLEHTLPTHPHYQKLLESLKQVEQTAQHINSLVEEQENVERMLELQRSLQNNYPCIIKPGRRLLKEGILMKMSRKRNRGYPRYFVLMSDILMYCKTTSHDPKTLQSLQCCCILPLNKCKIDDMLNGSSFKLTCQNETFVLYSDTLTGTQSWIKVLRESVKDYVECRKTLRKDSSRRQPIRKRCDIEFDYLGLSPALLKQKKKFQDFEDVFYVRSTENTTNKTRYFPFNFGKRPLSSGDNAQEMTSKRIRISTPVESHLLDLKEEELDFNNRSNESEGTTSVLYNIFTRMKNSVKSIFKFK